MKKNYLGIIVVVIILVALVAWGLSGQSLKKETGPIRIGIVTHLSGDYSSYGQNFRRSSDLAAEAVNSKGGINGRELKLVYEDDQTTNNGAVEAVNKLINVDRLSVIMSAEASNQTGVILPITQKNKVLTMIVLGTSPDFTGFGSYVFRMIPSDAYQGHTIASSSRTARSTIWSMSASENMSPSGLRTTW